MYFSFLQKLVPIKVYFFVSDLDFFDRPFYSSFRLKCHRSTCYQRSIGSHVNTENDTINIMPYDKHSFEYIYISALVLILVSHIPRSRQFNTLARRT